MCSVLCVMAAESICETRFVSTMVDDDADESVSRISHFSLRIRQPKPSHGSRLCRRCQADGYSAMAAPQHTHSVLYCRRQIMAVFAVLRFLFSRSPALANAFLLLCGSSVWHVWPCVCVFMCVRVCVLRVDQCELTCGHYSYFPSATISKAA